MNKVSELFAERVNHLSTIMENDLPKWRKFLWNAAKQAEQAVNLLIGQTE